MTLAEKLRERTASSGRTEQVECGELGSVTVEAFPVREIELLYRGPDGLRKVFYAACRGLQRAGEELRRAGQVYTPDGILQFVTESEADSAARMILKLSRWQGVNNVYRADLMEDAGVNNVYRPNEEIREIRPLTVQKAEKNFSQVRLETVQKAEKNFSQVRPETVQSASGVVPLTEQNRLNSVQLFSEKRQKNGQDSRETRPEIETVPKVFESDIKPQGIDRFSPKEAQNVVSEFLRDGRAPQNTDDGIMILHEIRSEFPGN